MRRIQPGSSRIRRPMFLGGRKQHSSSIRISPRHFASSNRVQQGVLHKSQQQQQHSVELVRQYHFTATHQMMFSQTNADYSTSPPQILNAVAADLDWNDRIGLQARYSLKQKGWKVQVDWRTTPHGAGLFALQDISKGTILRTGVLGKNLMEFTSIQDIDDFCMQQGDTSEIIQARRNYVKDYLWGFSKFADENGYPLDAKRDILEDGSRRFYGMWIPGNGLNHNTTPNTVYRLTDNGINLVALTDIKVNDELIDDYRRHGTAPEWLKGFALQHDVTLNFADCNDFVEQEQDD